MIRLTRSPTFESVPGLISAQLCGTTSGLVSESLIASPGRTVDVLSENVKLVPGPMAIGRAFAISPRHGFGARFVSSAMSARIGWAAIVLAAGRYPGIPVKGDANL